MDFDDALLVQNLRQDVQAVSERVSDVERRLQDVHVRLSGAEASQGDDDSFKMVSQRLSTLEEILGRIGGVQRAVHQDVAEAELAQLVDRRQNQRASRRGSMDSAAQEAADSLEAAERQLLEARVRGADTFFSKLGRRLTQVEAGVVQVRTDLERAVRRVEAGTLSEVATLRDAARELLPGHRLLEDRLTSAEARLIQLSQGLDAPGGLPGTAAKLNLLVEELRDKVQCLDRDVQNLSAPKAGHDTDIRGIEVKLNSLGLRLSDMEGCCKELAQKVTEADGLRQPLRSDPGRSRRWFRKPRWLENKSRVPAEDREAPTEGAHLSAKVRDLEEMLKRLDRHFSGFVAELNGFTS